MKLLNLGCGTRYHPDWINIGFVSTNKNIIVHNLLKGIPFKDNDFDVVYHSHLLEHFSKQDAIDFIKECHRVLKSGGIIRIATPNLEEIVKNYIKYLNRSLENDKTAEFKYDFTMVEMYDQFVRNFSGGALGQLYKKGDFLDPNFVYKRTGFKKPTNRKRNIDYMSKKQFQYVGNKLAGILHKALRGSFNVNIKEDLLKVVLGKEYRYYELGKFRLDGEVHQWMYDRFSLKRLLTQNKFKDVKICQATESKVPNWNSYNLDTNLDGTVYKPDSIFVEA